MSGFMDYNDNTFQMVYSGLKGKCKNGCRNFAILKVAFANEEVSLLYEKAIVKHNNNFTSNVYCDSGLDLFVPEDAIFDREMQVKYVDMKLKTEMVYCEVATDQIYPTGYYLYPRSSLSKTPLILANHVGIIDSGYRGSVIGAFKWAPPPTSSRIHYAVEEGIHYEVEEGTRLVQICHPSLCPIYIQVVTEAELSSTERGVGGFGSTGV